MSKEMTVRIAPLSVVRGELVASAPVQTVTLPGNGMWDALEREYISKGWEYSARKTVRGYDPPYAILVHKTLGFVAIWA